MFISTVPAIFNITITITITVSITVSIAVTVTITVAVICYKCVTHMYNNSSRINELNNCMPVLVLV